MFNVMHTAYKVFYVHAVGTTDSGNSQTNDSFIEPFESFLCRQLACYNRGGW
jgi:hypothetical protein